MHDLSHAPYVHVAQRHQSRWTVLHRRGDQFLGRTLCLDKRDAKELAAALSSPPAPEVRQ